MAGPIIMHVNCCEQGQSLEDICAKAAAWGYDGVEFRRKRRGAAEQPEAYLDAIAKAAARAGLRTVIFGSPGPDLAVADDRRRAAEIDEALAFYRLAAERFDLSVCNALAGNVRNPAAQLRNGPYECHGSFIATERQWDDAAAGYKTLGQAAAALGFRFAFETHMHYIHDTPKAAMRLVERIDHPAVGVNLDYENVLYFQEHPELSDALRLLGSRLYYVHLKNSVGLEDGSRMACGLGEGDINHRAYLNMLKQSGYDGPICLETPRAGDREWFARTDIAYLQSVLRDLEWA